MNCYILTGGRSTRMRQSKAEMFLGRINSAAAEVFDRVVAVQRRGMAPLSISTIFEDDHEDEAPVFGVLRALGDTDGPCFILATDYPLLTVPVLRDLRARFEKSNASLLVPVWAGKPQLLCAGYRTCVAPRIQERVAQGRLDLRGLLEEADVELIAEDDLRRVFAGEPLMNVNTPEDMQRAERLL